MPVVKTVSKILNKKCFGFMYFLSKNDFKHK